MSRNAEGWGPWIEWQQGPRPMAAGMMVQAEMGYVGSCDFVGPVPSEDVDWDFPGDPVVRYRVQRPQALLSMIEEAKKLDAPVKETTQ